MYSDFENRYKGEMNSIRTTYNNEASQLEFILIRDLDNSENLLAKLSAASSYALSPFVTQSEVDQYRHRKLAWLRDPKNEPQRMLQYFQIDRIHRFIHDTAKELRGMALLSEHGFFTK